MRVRLGSKVGSRSRLTEAKVPYRVKNSHEASLDLSKSYLSKCESLILSLESTSDRIALNAEDCLALWSELGDVRRGVWSELSPSEKADLDTRSGKLEARLRTLLGTRRQDLLSCLESGVLRP